MDSADDIEGADALDERIAELGDAVMRCRKISLAAKFLVGAGATCLAALLLGMTVPTPPLTIAAVAAVLGGLVLLGSNASTWEQTDRALAAAYAARDGARLLAFDDDAEPSGRRPALHFVGDDRPTLH